MIRLFRLAAFVLLPLLASPASAQTLMPRADDRAMEGDFSVLALITADPDWERQWAGSTPPAFTTTDHLGPGKEGAILVFFSGATLVEGKARLTCDLTIHSPEGRESHPPHTCYEGELPGDRFNIYLTWLDIDLGFDPKMPPTTVEFEIGVTDEHGSVRLPVTVGVTFNSREGTI